MSHAPPRTLVLLALLLGACAAPPAAPGTPDEGLRRDARRVQVARTAPAFKTTVQSTDGVTATLGLPERGAPGPRAVGVTPPLKLNLTSMCSGLWRVRNPNTTAVAYTWDVFGGPQKGGGIAPALADTFFETTPANHTVRLFVSGSQHSVKSTNPSPCAPRGEGRVSVDAVTMQGQSVAGASVTLTLPDGTVRTGTTTAEGNLAFTDLPLGTTFTVRATLPDGRAAQGAGFLNADSRSASATLVLAEPGAGSVSGNVTREDGTPLPGAVVTLSFVENDFAAATVSGPDGAFALSGLPLYGTLGVTAHHPTTGAFVSGAGLLVSDTTQAQLDLEVRTPAAATVLIGGDFAGGRLDGWTTEGDVSVSRYDEVFGEAGPPEPYLPPTPTPIGWTSAQTGASPSRYVAVASTRGDRVAVGRLSQSFTVGACHTRLVGKVRFLSNEYPTWYRTRFNDSYSVHLVTPGGARTLAAGNLNNSSWGGGMAGYRGAADVRTFSVDVRAYAGGNKPLTLAFQANDVGDMAVDSAVGVADVRLVDDSALKLGTQSVGGAAGEARDVGLQDVTFEAPRVMAWVVPDTLVPADVATPFTEEDPERGLLVVIRQRDIAGGKVTFRVPVRTLSARTGEPLNLTTEKRLSFQNTPSTPTRIVNGAADIPVTVTVGAGDAPVPVDLDTLRVESGGVTAQSSERCASTVPLTFRGSPPPSGRTRNTVLGLPSEMFSAPEGLRVDTMFDDIRANWDNTKFVLKLVYDMIPVLGDGTELVVQYANHLMGRGVDPVVATLAGVGLALDVVPAVGTVSGGVVSGAKTLYRLSKAGHGVIADAVAHVMLVQARGRSPREAVELLTGEVRFHLRLLNDGGVAALKQADADMDVIRSASGFRARHAVTSDPRALALRASGEYQSYHAAVKEMSTNVNYTSPGGLFYGTDPNPTLGTRLAHVLVQHGPNQDATRFAHKSRFIASTDEATLALLDEVYAFSRTIGQSGPNPSNVVVDLGRPIGANGERTVLLAFDAPGSNVLRTAFPCDSSYWPTCKP
ncbi:carboxypeptidase-like regulatory domain-containing protein [Deinococcus pimensis]|uniref:carboxypeptidase-like regulatory domain-containing protein n=1 Tax=Deinococcus pimensis TaxID=309888 RepID=UPI000483892D|nr:carboxypeptidase-like regulatory domain-containing protein [Deinococcus pimensis]